MSKLTITQYGNSILRKKTRNISLAEIDTKNNIIRSLVYDMIETMKCADGIGIAAPQVGISLSLCIITQLQKNISNNNIIMINPKIIFKNNNKIRSKEGCLSLPGIYEYISRFNEIFCEYVNLDCKNCYIEAKGLLSIIIQHEVDHLNSILFIDYLPRYKKLNIDTRLKKNKSGL